MAPVCQIALIGQKFMGRIHSNAYLKADKFFNLPLRPGLHTIVGLDLISLAPFADRWGWKKYLTSWKEAIKDPTLNLVDICTPNYMHADQAMAALAAGKHVAVEKPLADTLKDARAMKNAAARFRRAQTFVWFNFRRCPAVALARQLVQEGRLGRVYHVRARYLQSWAGASTPLVWRFQRKYAGSGALGDLSSHIIDLARFITGQQVEEISGALAETFITHREVIEDNAKLALKIRPPKRKSMGKSDVDDCAVFLAKMTGGTVAVFESSRLATGHLNHNTIEINGELGALRFSLEQMNELEYFDAREEPRLAGWRRIVCTQSGHHPYAGAWWPDGHLLAYEHTFVNMVADMMAVLAGEQPIVPLPDFDDAYETQRVLEAAQLSAKHRAAIKMSEVK